MIKNLKLLKNIGFNKTFCNKTLDLQNSEEAFSLARITQEQKNFYRLFDGNESFWGKLSGKFFLSVSKREELPTIGDFVVFEKEANQQEGLITSIIPRNNAFIRKLAGKNVKLLEEQVLAANIDYVFIVMSLDKDFNLSRLERYLALTASCGLKELIILSKTDIAFDEALRLKEVQKIAPKANIIQISNITKEGIDKISAFLSKGQTAALLGASGVGKSSLINSLFGQEIQKTGNIREKDGRGRHITTFRSMFFLKNGGIIIDSPGIREVSLISEEGDVIDSYEDIKVLAKDCKFNNCTHTNEPECAVINAVEQGKLDETRYLKYLKLTAQTDKITKKKSRLKIFTELKQNKYAHKFKKKTRNKI